MIFTQSAARDKIASLESRIADLESDLVAKDEALALAQSEIVAKDQAIAEHASAIESRDAKISELEASTETFVEEMKAKDAEIAEAKESAGKVAAEMLATAGQPEPLPQAENEPESKTMTRAQFNALTPAQKSAFCINGGTITA